MGPLSMVVCFQVKITRLYIQNGFRTGGGSIPTAVRFADFGNDHQEDIVVVVKHGKGTFQIFLVHYDGDFSGETSYTTGSGPHP